jgi:hypothetical protein
MSSKDEEYITSYFLCRCMFTRFLEKCNHITFLVSTIVQPIQLQVQQIHMYNKLLIT